MKKVCLEITFFRLINIDWNSVKIMIFILKSIIDNVEILKVVRCNEVAEFFSINTILWHVRLHQNKSSLITISLFDVKFWIFENIDCLKCFVSLWKKLWMPLESHPLCPNHFIPPSNCNRNPSSIRIHKKYRLTNFGVNTIFHRKRICILETLEEAFS